MIQTEISRRCWRRGACGAMLLCVFVAQIGIDARGADNTAKKPAARVEKPQPAEPPKLPLTQEQKERLDKTVDKALEFLAAHQNSDGSFQTEAAARPAVTSLCVMAFLSRGHKPSEGQYGENLERAIDYVLQFQDPETGAITPVNAGVSMGFWSRAGSYTHGICATMLADVFPLTGRVRFQKGRAESEAAQADQRRHDRIDKAVRKALSFTRAEQGKQKVVFGEQGGWRYLEPMSNDSDLSVTAWMMMFLHSAQKSGFKVSEKTIKGGLRFVHHTFSKKQHGFVYVLSETNRRCTRGTVGGGILCLLLSGESPGPQVKEAADWIFDHPFEPYNRSFAPADRYHYSAFYCSQAMGLLGGAYFRDFYPGLLRVLADNQHSDGSWEAESLRSDTGYGEVYSTALAVLALSPPYQMLQTYQR